MPQQPPLAIHTPPPSVLSEAAFSAASDAWLGALEEILSAAFERAPAAEAGDWEASLSAGVLTVNLGAQGVFVLNKQAPNRQIWLSSPVSGPARFNWNAEQCTWAAVRGGGDLLSRLATEVAHLTSGKVPAAALAPAAAAAAADLRARGSKPLR